MKNGMHGKLSRKMPTKDLAATTVVVETGSGRDRREGYEKDNHSEFTGADARAALVGQYRKKNQKKFAVKNSPKRTYGSSGY